MFSWEDDITGRTRFPLSPAPAARDYGGLNGMLDGVYPKGAFNSWKSSFLRQLSYDAIDKIAFWKSGAG
jgi:hypothetical protein